MISEESSAVLQMQPLQGDATNVTGPQDGTTADQASEWSSEAGLKAKVPAASDPPDAQMETNEGDTSMADGQPTAQMDVVAETAAGDQLVGESQEDALEDEDEEEDEDEDDDDDDSDDSYVPKYKEAKDDSEDGQGSDRASAVHASQEPVQQRMHACIHKKQVEPLRELAAAEPALLQATDRLGRTPLHLALMRCQPEMVAALLSSDSTAVGRAVKMPFRGSGSSGKDKLSTLHLALTAAPFEKSAPDALRCLEMLLAQKHPDINEADGTGKTVLHLACAQGSTLVLDTLLQHRADPGAQDALGQLPLHYAIDSRNQQCVQKMLGFSNPTLFEGGLHPFYRCIDCQAWGAAFLIYRQGWPIPVADVNRLFDFAAARGLASEWNFVSEKGVEGSCSLEELQWPPEIFGPAATAVVTHPVCLSHGVLPLDIDDPNLRHRLIRQTPENPHRLEVLCGEQGILRSDAFRDLRWVSEPAPAPLADILRVHEDWYVHGLMERVKEVSALGRGERLPLDGGDTKVTAESWNAATRACGSVLEAVELVCNEQVRNAFCAVRPPGHHLGPGGACNTTEDLEDDPEGSQGFCLLNNVAVGAAYARCVYRHIIRRVAIVDFDVHHGNGTEAIVRRVKWKQHSSPITREFLVRGVRGKIVAETPASCRPWLDPESDAENLFFASIHGYGNGFYPGTGAGCNESSPKIVNVTLRPGANSADFRAGLRDRILPELVAFDPDILFVSAGFDGHDHDLIGCCRCIDEDYIWVTKQLLSVANRCCQGRLISVLEGGYNTRAELLSPFAQTVAGHVQTLMHTSSNYCNLECEVQGTDERSREAAAASRKRKLDETQEPEEDGAPGTRRVSIGSADADALAKEAEEMRLVFGSDDETAANGLASEAAPQELMAPEGGITQEEPAAVSEGLVAEPSATGETADAPEEPATSA